MDNTIIGTEQVQEQPKQKVIGQFKPKEKFLEFVGGRGNIQFHADEALIEAKYLSGLDMDGITLKLTICDEGTVNFDEVDTNKTTAEQRERLLDVISEKTISMFNNNMVVTELPFKSVQKIKDKEISLYLAVEYQTPISKLASIFDEETIEVSDEQNSKLSDLLSSFDEGDQSLAEILFSSETDEEIKREFEGESDEEIKSDAQKAMEESFAKMKEEKLNELKNRLDQQTQELKRYQYEKAQAEGKIETAKTDIRVLESRIESLQPPIEPNGYYFFVSEQLNDKSTLDETTAKLIYDKISKLKSINADAFMKLFEAGEYQVRLGAKSMDALSEITDYNSLPDDIKISLQKVGIALDSDKKLFYNGELKWHDIVDKMIRHGFSQDPEFDKMCGSNSYFAMYGSNDNNESAEKQNEEKLTNKLEETTEEKFKSLAEFETPNDIVILGDYQDIGNKFEITDDETSFEIYQDGKSVASLSSSGFGSIMTLKDYQKLHEEKGEEMAEWGIVSGVVVPNFSGTIGIAAITYNSTHNPIYHIKFDLSDYIQHQISGWCGVVVNVPSGFNVIRLNDDLSLPVEVLRDIKIDVVTKS